MRIKFLLILLIFFGINTFAQKMIGYGGELSVLSIKPNVRLWISKTTGFEVFGGLASQLGDFKPDDLEVGFKFIHSFIYQRTTRTYFGVVGKWKWAKGYDPNYKINLPIGGLLIGKEWFNKKVNRKGFAIEFGYQYGEKKYVIYSPIHHVPQPGKEKFDEFPLIINLRYTFYKKK